MGFNDDSPFTGGASNIKVPASSVQPGSRDDNPNETPRAKSIQVKPQALKKIVPSTQG